MENPRILILPCGHKAVCPFCKKEYAVPPSVHSMGTQGVWAHISAKHKNEPRNGMYEAFASDVGHAANLRRKIDQERKATQKAMLAAEKKEAHEAPLRKHTLTGAFLMDLREELSGALSMMEPYYIQCHADQSGREMVSKLEYIISRKNP